MLFFLVTFFLASCSIDIDNPESSDDPAIIISSEEEASVLVVENPNETKEERLKREALERYRKMRANDPTGKKSLANLWAKVRKSSKSSKRDEVVIQKENYYKLNKIQVDQIIDYFCIKNSHQFSNLRNCKEVCKKELNKCQETITGFKVLSCLKEKMHSLVTTPRKRRSGYDLPTSTQVEDYKKRSQSIIDNYCEDNIKNLETKSSCLASGPKILKRCEERINVHAFEKNLKCLKKELELSVSWNN
jgi:hypothetical protein